MPKECYVCGKKITSGHQVSHSNIHTKRTWKPNLKKVRIVENNTAKN
ncbi:50S ribosomal protein L28, partial [Anaerofustis stercorihominis]